MAIRETVESVVIAFILAFLFRTFEAEAFVIPTGSMAPTLMGKHKDVSCPECQHEYQVSASDSPPDQNGNVRAAMVGSGTCPMCRYTADLTENNSDGASYPSYNGDRIIVAKFPFALKDPDRWDVIVFRFPGEAMTNYIKRLIGKPGDTVRIRYGDIWIRKEGEEEFKIARKPPEKLLAMLQPVYDNDLAPTITGKLGWPARWQPLGGGGPGEWTSADDASFSTSGEAAGETWLRYQHLVPSYAQWDDMLHRGAVRPGDAVRPQLISDFTPYNTGRQGEREPPDCTSIGIHWVGDLAVQCNLEVQSESGEVVFELIKGGRPFRCRIDLATGVATLGIGGPDAASFHPSAKTSVRGKCSRRIIFSNVDEQLRLWVNGSPIAFDGPTEYDSLNLQTRMPTEADLSPVGIAAQKAAVKVSHVKLMRDIYYIATNDLAQHCLMDYREVQPDLSDPQSWSKGFGEPNMNEVEFKLQPHDPSHPEKDQFFVLGDNSAQSKDGRLWGAEYWVNRELLIGKALLIYWPHSWDKLPGTNIPFPFFPNFKRMHMVR
jgi:signal peptidase I